MSGEVKASDVRDGTSLLRCCSLSLCLCVPVVGQGAWRASSSPPCYPIAGHHPVFQGRQAEGEKAADGESGLMPWCALPTHPGGCVSHFPPCLQTHPSYSSFPPPALLYQSWLFPLVGSVELCEIPTSLNISLKKNLSWKLLFSPQSPGGLHL